jgi:two-component system sensor histidine kinase VicK
MPRNMTSGRTEVWSGLDNISKKSWRVLSRAKATSDYFHDSKSPSYLVANDQYFQIIKQLKAKGIRQRFVTEITHENVRHSKELAKYVELRHLEAVKGNFGIVDGKEYGAAANIYDLQPPVEFIYSNVKTFVDQQQYFFETLWDKAIPAEQRIREIEEGIPVETTEIIDGTENILDKAIEGLSLTKERFDNCIDHTCPSSYVLTKQIWDKCIELRNRGIRLRFITEITSENIPYCKEIMKIAELRHLDGIRGNFGISDGRDYRATASMQQGQPPAQAIRSTIKTFVEQQQFFFETLWNKAIPAEKKIREIEEGIPAEVTEIWYGREDIIKKSWEIISRAKVSSDYCHNSKTPSIFVTHPHYLRAMMELSERGVRHRFLTEITKENIAHCKKLAKYVELRHLDGVRGSFSIIDGKEYGADPNPSEFRPPTEFIYSNVKKFVDQQQYFFQTLWNKAIPAEHRITQLEEGIMPESIETLSDPHQIQNLATKLIDSAKKELLIVFASTNDFYRQHNASDGFLNSLLSETAAAAPLKHKTMPQLQLRITVPLDGDNKKLQSPTDDLSTKEKFYSSRVQSEIRYIDAAALSTSVTVIVVDRKYCLVVEVKDDSDKAPRGNDLKDRNRKSKGGGLAIYTNSKALVLSTVSMFELLWAHIDLYEELRLRDIAQREFISVAAHELRGPIQPILGLANEIRARQHQGRQGKMLSVILDSATNLQKLANNILDVARIENRSLKLQKARFDLNELIFTAIQNFDNELIQKAKVRIQFKPTHRRLSINADKERIFQVVSNLLSNAIKFTDEGLISISVKKREKNKTVEVSIRDTGKGIDEEVLPMLFTKFVTSSSGGQGTGLGLFISKKILEAHGGRLYGTNNDAGPRSRGATFTFIMPIGPHS